MSQTMMSVSSLNTKIKSLLEATFMHTLVEGEVASVTYHTSGHLYFSIKDDKSSIKCVMWRSSAARMKFRIEKGMHIVVEGSVSVYTPRGEYQFQTVRIEPYGQGVLALAYEQLKEKLKSKGYFDTDRKKQIPRYIQKIALVTAKDSAALHDMLKIIEKRWRALEVMVVDTLVQGEQAAPQIARALAHADSLDADVVVVGRGGGSVEDLWAFNEEVVADAIHAMQTPVVSAVGHEVDVMISDFVADLRAPTPSAAIEMILPDSAEILYTLNELETRLHYAIKQSIHDRLRQITHMEELFVKSSPKRVLLDVEHRFLHYKDELQRTYAYKMQSFLVQIPQLQREYQQTVLLTLKKKQQYVELLNEKFKISDPASRCHEGWAQISQEGKTVKLEELDIEEKFILQDEHTQIEALCLSKKET